MRLKIWENNTVMREGQKKVQCSLRAFSVMSLNCYCLFVIAVYRHNKYSTSVSPRLQIKRNLQDYKQNLFKFQNGTFNSQ